jgi:hypothetical protein
MPEIPCIRINFSDINIGQVWKGIWMLGMKMKKLSRAWSVLSLG